GARIQATQFFPSEVFHYLACLAPGLHPTPALGDLLRGPPGQAIVLIVHQQNVSSPELKANPANRPVLPCRANREAGREDRSAIRFVSASRGQFARSFQWPGRAIGDFAPAW